MNAHQFLKLVEQSSLLPADLLSKLARKLADTPSIRDAEGVAKWMVDKGHLTAWQARQLLAGRNAFYLGRYRLLERIGKGGMGVVFKAQHAVMDRVVALKVMSPTLLRNPRAVARFNREVKAAAALHHPNIITAYDADSVGTTHFLVMEFVDGHDLNWWLRTLGPLPPSLACECAMQAAEGLAHAHHLGMVHRDIKPVNLLVAWNERAEAPLVKVLDLGLARFVSESQEDGGLTRLGQAIGTPDYIAPEAAENFKLADIRADIFSLGCTLYKLLCGRLPFGGENTMEKLMARAMNDAPPIRQFRPSIPEAVEAVVAKMLARKPEERYQSPSEVAADLRPLAASTLHEASILKLLAPPSEAAKPALESVVADADTSLDLFRDLSMVPSREAGEAPHTMVEEGYELADADSPPEAPARSGKPRSESKIEELAPMVSASDVLLRERAAADPDDELAEIFDQVDTESEPSLSDRLSGAPEVWTQSRPRPRRNAWDSPLILVGGAVLALLLLAAASLGWMISRRGGDQAFEQAEQEYQDGNFAQSVDRFDRFLEQYPRHDQAELAKVHRSLARLRHAIDSTRDWPRTLELARREIESIAPLPEFANTGNDLAVLLPRIAEGLADDAKRQPSAERIEAGRASLGLIDKYVVPKSLQPAERLAQVERTLALAERDLKQSERLKAAAATIVELAAKGDFAGAERERRALLAAYPNLDRAAELLEAQKAVAAAAKKTTRFVAEARPAVREPRESAVAAALPMATRNLAPDAPQESPRAFALAGGAVYALSGSDGRVLWRKYVGFDATRLPVEQADGGALVYDSVHRELQNLDAERGELRWRLALSASPAGEPLSLDKATLVATSDGRLTRLDPGSGETQGYTPFPQPIVGAPTLEPRGRRLYQLGAYSHLFVLDANSLDCQEVVDLGHAEASVVVSPAVVSRYVIVAENHQANAGRLRVLAANDEGLQLTEVQQIPYEGHVVSPAQIADRYLHVFTDRGGVLVFGVSTADEKQPLTPLIQTLTGSEDRVAAFARISGANLWIGDDRLTKFTVQPAAARIEPQWTIDRGDVFTQPLVVQGPFLISARTRRNFGGVTVSAVGVDDGKAIWETQLAAPPTDVAAVDDSGSRLSTLSTTGALFQVDLASPLPSALDSPLARLELAAHLPTRQQMPPGPPPWALAAAPGRLLVCDPAASQPLRWLATPAPALAQALRWREGWLVPCEPGLVHLVDDEGKKLAEPFQPRIEANAQAAWTPATAIADGEALIADGRAKLYRLTLADDPAPHVAAVREGDTPEPIVSAIAVGQKFAVAVDAVGHLNGFSLDTLALGPQLRLSSPLAWGPKRIGDRIFVALGDDRLLALQEDVQPAWEAKLSGALVGSPQLVEGRLILALRSGQVIALDAADGRLVQQIDVGQALGGGPIQVAGRWFVVGDDGTLFELRSAP